MVGAANCAAIDLAPGFKCYRIQGSEIVMNRIVRISALVLVVLATGIPAAASPGSSCLVLCAESDAAELENVTTVTLRVAGMMKSRSGAT